MYENSLRAAANLTRRAFMGVVALGGAALVASAGTLLTQAAQPGGHCSPVLSFHMDQPYLDVTGTAVPYYPPPGVRSGDSAAELSEDVFRSLLL